MQQRSKRPEKERRAETRVGGEKALGRRVDHLLTVTGEEARPHTEARTGGCRNVGLRKSSKRHGSNIIIWK